MIRISPLLAAATIAAGAPAYAVVRPADPFVSLAPQPATPLPLSERAAATPAVAPSALPVDRALDALQGASRARFDVQADPNTGNVKILAAGRSHAYAGTASQAATAFLKEAQGAFGANADPALLAAPVAEPHVLGTRVIFQQQVNGVPVLGHAVSVNVNASGEVIFAENATAPIGGVITTPSISAVQAAGAARGEITSLPVLAIDPRGAAPRLVWRFEETDAGGALIRVTVDAQTGDVLERRSMVLYATGSGQVYTGNPVSTPTREVKPFLYLDGTGNLTGSYTKTYHYGGSGQTSDPTFAPVQDVNVPSLQFNFAPGTDQLSEAQAYYGITTIHDYFKSTFSFTGRDQVVPGYVRVPNLLNAYFTPSTVAGNQATPNGYMAFGYGAVSGYPTRDFALDSDVLYHEYTHAVMFKLNADFSNASFDDAERGGIGEGVADYFSCSFLNDPQLAEYVGQALGASPLRDLRGRKHYPEEVLLQQGVLSGGVTYIVRTYPEVHQTGEIWGPALWDLRIMLGKTKADQVIFKGMALLSSVSTFQSALGALLTADDALYGGVDKGTIREVLNARGITETVFPIKYLPYNAFGTGGSTLNIGVIGQTGDGHVVLQPYDTFASFNVGDLYQLQGLVSDPAIQTVVAALRNAQGQLVSGVIMSVRTFSGVDNNGNPATFHYVFNYFSFPSTAIPVGNTALTGLRYSIESYTDDANTVADLYGSLVPKAVAPSGGVNYSAQLLVAQTTQVFTAPAFGDTDGDGAVTLPDALLVMRALSGGPALTADQIARADIAPPVAGTTDAADARLILQRVGGLQ
jgi:Zn-dependent metalloprotease